MSALGDLLFELLGEFLALPVVGLAINAAALLLATFWLASAWWAYRDAGRRTGDPITPYLVAAGVLLLTPLFFPLALVVWRVLRPASTLRERYAADLQRELLVLGASRAACPSCARPVEDDWVRCPSCRVALAGSCAACERPVGLDWSICAWCATDLPERGPVAAPAPEPAPASFADDPASDAVAPKRRRGKVAAAKALGPGIRRSAAMLGAPGTLR